MKILICALITVLALNHAVYLHAAVQEPLIRNEYSISLEYFPETRDIIGFQRVTYTNRTGSPQARVLFNLYFNAFAEGYAPTPYFRRDFDAIFPKGIGYGGINVINTFVNGDMSRHSVNGTSLTVFLPFVLEKEQEVSISVHFEATIPEISHRTGANGNTAWFGNFVPLLSVYNRAEQQWRADPYYPAGRPFFSNIANFNVKITTPADYIVVGTGDASVSEAGDHKTTAFNAVLVRDFAFAASNEYRETTFISESGVHVKTFMLSDIDENTSFSIAIEALDYFSETIGGYPYKSFKIAENGNYAATAIYPQLIFVNTETVQSADKDEAALQLVSAVAKQWFYGVVGNDQIREAWLCDGLAYYTAVRFLNRGDEEGLERHMTDLAAGVKREIRLMEHSSAIAGHISVYASNAAHTAIQTHKAALMFHALRGLIGSEAYDEFLRIYYRTNYLAIANEESLIRAAEEAYNGCLRGFFDAWLHGEGLPEGGDR
ncbi:MAG: M1 family metallopeptidase [Defluviitaleaceae bacterium]|nr:M1 family metallopeptidase [Defluviitaleaceae bacterium]MCL2836216.1 M1 family metallopeptidase [Defluviitaleaceae bacterium]